MDILIFGGQSNMQGQTEGLPCPNPIVEGAFEYRQTTDELLPLKHPVGENIGTGVDSLLRAACEGGGNLVPAFCREYQKLTGRQVIAVHAARGNTTIAEWRKGTKRYDFAKTKINKAIEKAKSLYEVEHIYYIWLQGESDAILKRTANDYLQDLIAYKNHLKADFGIEKFGIIKVGYFASLAPWVAGTPEEKAKDDEAIMNAQECAAILDEDFVILTRICPELSRDSVYINPYAVGHYNNAAMEIIGKEAAKRLAQQ